MHVHPYAWFITIGIMTVILALDVLVLGRRPHEPSMKECGIFVGFFVGLAVLFGLGVSHISGPRYGKEFFAGWLTEYSLSLDNLFIFLIIMAKMKVPRKLQQYALLVGIILALIFRGIFIAMGAAIINRFAFVFFAFGASGVGLRTRLLGGCRRQIGPDRVALLTPFVATGLTPSSSIPHCPGSMLSQGVTGITDIVRRTRSFPAPSGGPR